jgi:hypothetical protein
LASETTSGTTNSETVTKVSENDFSSSPVSDLDQVEADLVAIGFDNIPDQTLVEDTTQPQDTTTDKTAEAGAEVVASDTEQPQALKVADPAKAETVTETVIEQAPVEKGASSKEEKQPSSGNSLYELAEAVNQNREALETALSEKVYKLSDEDKANLEANPGEVLPKLMAKLHMEVAQNVLGAVANNIPQTFAGLMEAQKRFTQNEDRFWGAWKDKGLDPVKHKDVVFDIATRFAKMYPESDSATRMKNVGAMALAQLGLLGVVQQQAASQQQRQQPFVPVGGGGATAVKPNATPSNPFAEMTLMMEMED